MQAFEVEGSIYADHSFKEYVLNSLLLDQKLVEAEETHDVAHKNLL